MYCLIRGFCYQAEIDRPSRRHEQILPRTLAQSPAHTDTWKITSPLSTMPLVFSGVEPLFNLSEYLDGPLHIGEELGLLLGNPTEGFRRLLGLIPEFLSCLACLLGLVPEFLSCLPGAFLHMPQHFGREAVPFRVLSRFLLDLPGVFRGTTLFFGAYPLAFGGFPALFSLLLCLPILAVGLINLHGALLIPEPTTHRFNAGPMSRSYLPIGVQFYYSLNKYINIDY
jgi:hypothetical protein